MVMNRHSLVEILEFPIRVAADEASVRHLLLAVHTFVAFEVGKLLERLSTRAAGIFGNRRDVILQVTERKSN
jgi:hypothetical protein